MYRYGEEYQVDYLRPDATWGELFNFTDQAGKFTSLKVPLLGRHQVENAGVALSCIISIVNKRVCHLKRRQFKKG